MAKIYTASQVLTYINTTVLSLSNQDQVTKVYILSVHLKTSKKAGITLFSF